MYFLFFERLRANTPRPPRLFTRARNPWRRFWTLRLGLYVSRLTPREAVDENPRAVAGHVAKVLDIGFGRRMEAEDGIWETIELL